MKSSDARAALSALTQISAHRDSFQNVLGEITNALHGPQGVSSDTQFMTDCLALYDAHVAHLIERRKTELSIALDAS